MLSHQKTCYIQCTTYFTHLSKRTLLENWVLREKHTAGGESLGQSKHTWKPNLFSKTQLKVFALSMDFWSRFPKRKMKEMHCVPEWFHQGILKTEKTLQFPPYPGTGEWLWPSPHSHGVRSCNTRTTRDRPDGTVKAAPHVKDGEMEIPKFKHLNDAISNMFTKSAIQQ